MKLLRFTVEEYLSHFATSSPRRGSVARYWRGTYWNAIRRSIRNVRDAVVGGRADHRVTGISRPGRLPGSTDDLTSSARSAQAATDAVITAEILDGSITTAMLADNAVTNAKAAQMEAQTVEGNSSGSAADPADLTVAEVQLLLGAPAVDLGSAPYLVVANDPTKATATANSDAIAHAISDYSGTGATLLLPQGKIYCERNGTSSSYCIKFGAGVNKLTLRGQGMRGTTIVQRGVGNGGDWHCLMFENCQDIEVCDLGIMQGVIECPEATQQQHLVFIKDTNATTRHIDLHDIFFGDCLGDMYRTFADSSPNIVRDLSLRNFVMEGGWPDAGNSIIQAWEGSTAYPQYAWVRNDSNKQYKCTVAGKSASSGGPTGTGTPFSWTSTAVSAAGTPTDTLTITAHGLKYGDGPFRFTTATALPDDLATGTDYWISEITNANTFKVSTKLDDPALIRSVEIQSTGNVDATLVAGPGLQHLDIVDDGATWQYVLHSPRGGARSGVSPQRGYSRMLIANGSINGAQNSAIDCEPTGSNTMEHLTIDTVFVNNINSHTSTACSFGGNSDVHAKHMAVRNLTVLGGDTIIGNVDDMLLDNFRSIGEAAWPADTRTPNLTVRQVCADLTISNIRCERTGTSADGACVDIALDAGSKNLSIVGGSVLNSTTNETILIKNPGPNCFIGGGLSIEYTGGSASAKSGIALTADGPAGADDLVIDGIRVKAPSKLKAAIKLATRYSSSMANLTVRNIDSAGQAEIGVYASFNTAAGSYDRTPVFESICNGTDLAWVIKDQGDTTDLTTVYPIVSGGRGSNAVRRFEGQAPPNSNLVANLGDVFTWSKAPTHTETWIKMTQTVAGTPNSTGWVLVPGGAERKCATGSADPSLALTVVSGTEVNLTLADGPSDGYRKMFIVVSGTGMICPTPFVNTKITTTGPCACELVWLANEAKWAVLSATAGAVVT
jgi:hypothetical protein